LRHFQSVTICRQLLNVAVGDFQSVTICHRLAVWSAAFTPLQCPCSLGMTNITARSTVKRHECRAPGDFQRGINQFGSGFGFVHGFIGD
jgi:hypothetical protein